MAQCVKCKAYTKYEGGLCYKCYKEQNQSDDDKTEGGLNDKDYNYRYSMINGRIAETLIQELFLSLDYNVFGYGMANTNLSICPN